MCQNPAFWVVGILLCVHTALLAWGAWRHSPTTDEVAYLPAGVWHRTTGQFNLAGVSPPLVRLMAAVPVVFAKPNTDWRHAASPAAERTAHQVGRSFLRANGSRSFWLFSMGRWACIPFSLLGALICYRWAATLYGPPSGLLALSLWCFSPNLLAHGQLVTADAALAALGIAASFAFWRWLKQPLWSRSLVMGMVLGLCELAKTTALIYFLIWPLLWVVYRFSGERAASSAAHARECGQILIAFFVALGVVNAGYAFQGSGKPLGAFKFVSATFAGPLPDEPREHNWGNRFSESWMGSIPLPVPEGYLLGIDLQRRDFEHSHRSFLDGAWKHGGWWYYYLYGLAVKVPLGTWLLLGLAVCASSFLRDYNAPWRDEICLIVPPIIILTLVSSQTAFSHHLRYVLPIAPFVIIWICKVGRAWQFGGSTMKLLVAFGLAWTIASSMYVYPHSLSYFNELAGGPRNGHHHLINSNIDWGQDLLYLRQWLDRHPQAAPLGLAFYGECDPHLAGVDFTLPPCASVGAGGDRGHLELKPGWYAVSVNYLHGHHFRVFNEYSERIAVREPCYTYFMEEKPVAMVGYTVYIYHLTEADVDRINRSRAVVDVAEEG